MPSKGLPTLKGGISLWHKATSRSARPGTYGALALSLPKEGPWVWVGGKEEDEPNN